MTFIVNHNGKVYQKDLGKNSTSHRRQDDQLRSGPRLDGSGALRRYPSAFVAWV
jgi:hypothetical protein